MMSDKGQGLKDHRRVQDLRESVLEKEIAGLPVLVKPNGRPFPHHKSILKTGDWVSIRGQSFKVAYVGETSVLLEPGSPFDFLLGKEEVDES